MKKTIRTALITFVAALAITTGTVISTHAGTFSYSTTGVSKTSDVTIEQYDKMINTLRGMTDAHANGDYALRDTGIVCNSYEEGSALGEALMKLFLGDTGSIIVCVNTGWDSLIVADGSSEERFYSVSRYGTNVNNNGHIYVGFNYDANEAEVMRQHDEAHAVLKSVMSTAPEGLYEKCRYYHDWISEVNTYDNDGYNGLRRMKNSVYSTICEGCSVCEGYARTFYALSFFDGINCSYISCKVKQEGHAINAVNVDGRWKEIDVTWDDNDPGISYDYFMIDMNEEWQENINKPYCTITG